MKMIQLPGGGWIDALQVLAVTPQAAAGDDHSCASAIRAYHVARGELGAVADSIFCGKHIDRNPIPSLSSVRERATVPKWSYVPSDSMDRMAVAA